MKKFFIFTCLLLLGCKQVSKESVVIETMSEISYERKIKIDNFDENAVLKYSDIYDSVKFVKLETRDDNLIGNINKIIATNDKFIILDNRIAKKIFVFDRDGKFLNAIGNNGEGPKEYDTPNDIAYDEYNDELLVLCHNKRIIMKFKLDGTFLKNIKIDYWVASISVAGKNSYLLYLNNYTQIDGKVNDYNILIIDENGKTISKLLPYDKVRIVMSPPSGADFRTFQNELLFSPYYSNMIFKIDLDSIKIRNKYYFDFGKHNIPPSLFKQTVTPKEFEKTVRGKSNYVFNITFAETLSHIISLFVYRGKLYTCIHSKESGITKYSANFVNDINSLGSGIFSTLQGNSLIGYTESQNFVEQQRRVVKEIEQNHSSIKEVLLKNLGDIPSSIFSDELKNNYSKAINSSTITLSEEEIEFINSIDESDNPVIQVATLKKF